MSASTRYILPLLAGMVGPAGVFTPGQARAQTAEIQEQISTNLQRKRLEGTWRPAVTNVDGRQDQYAFIRSSRQKLIFKGDTFERKNGATILMKGTYAINPSRTPMTMDLNVAEPKGAPAKVQQVYECKGDRLWILTAKAGRATDLKPGKDRQLVIYERQYTAKQLMQVLELEIDSKKLGGPMTFKEFLVELREAVAAAGKSFPVTLDSETFKHDDPAMGSPWDIQILFPPGSPQKQSANGVLHAALKLFPVGAPLLIRRGTLTEIAARGEPALILRDGEIVITTRFAAARNLGRQEPDGIRP